MLPRWSLALAFSLVACGGAVVADDQGLGFGDWNLSYVDAGSYYGGGRSGRSSAESPSNTDDDDAASTDAGAPDDATTDAGEDADDDSPR